MDCKHTRFTISTEEEVLTKINLTIVRCADCSVAITAIPYLLSDHRKINAIEGDLISMQSLISHLPYRD